MNIYGDLFTWNYSIFNFNVPQKKKESLYQQI